MGFSRYICQLQCIKYQVGFVSNFSRTWNVGDKAYIGQERSGVGRMPTLGAKDAPKMGHPDQWLLYKYGYM